MNDTRLIIENYLPAIEEFFKGSPVNYRQLDSRYQNNLTKRGILKSSGIKQVSANIYDICQQAQVGIPIAQRLLVYFNSVCAELNKNLQSNKIETLKATFVNFLSEPDYNYLNFLGEISILNQIIKTGKFTLSDVEYPLGNGFFTDFRFFHVADKAYSLVEVVNLHLKEGMDLSQAGFTRFAEGKLKEKLRKKGYGPKHIFTLAPVVWGEGNQLLEIYNLYKAGLRLSIPDVLIPSAFLNYYYESGETYPVFGTLDTLFHDSIKDSFS